MVDETKEQHDVETGYFGKDQPGKEQSGNQIDRNGEKKPPPALTELLDTQATDRSYTQAALTIGPPTAMFTFHTKSALFQVLSINGISEHHILAKIPKDILQLR